MSNCKLCLQARKLCNSHILPEFVFLPLYDEHHSCRFFSVDPAARTPLIRKGFREQLLCAECESHLSRYECYARETLFGGRKLKAICGNTFIGLDYRKLKLFQLSTLWRASVTTLQYFKQVELGQYEESLRQMIHAEYPGKETDYPCLMTGLAHEGKPTKALVLEPEKSRYLHHHCFRFVFAGVKWLYIVTTRKLPDKSYQRVLKEDGTLRCVVEELKDQEFIKRIDCKSRQYRVKAA